MTEAMMEALVLCTWCLGLTFGSLALSMIGAWWQRRRGR